MTPCPRSGVKAHPATAGASYEAELVEMYREFEATTEPVRGEPLPEFDHNSPEAQEALARERAQATADWDCRDSLAYDSEMLRTQFTHEQAFINEQRALLEEFRDALAAWRAQNE